MTNNYQVSIYKEIFWKRVLLFDAYFGGYEETLNNTKMPDLLQAHKQATFDISATALSIAREWYATGSWNGTLYLYNS